MEAFIWFVLGTTLLVWGIAKGRRAQPGTNKYRHPQLPTLDLSDPVGECDFHIVGESNYQPELRRVAKSGRTFRAVVLSEPTNPYDPNAIRVFAEGGRAVGYFDSDYAIKYREAFALLAAHEHIGACQAKLIGGVPGKKSFGVMLNIKDPETILVDMRDTLAPGTAVSPSVEPF